MFQELVRPLLSKAKPSCVYSILKPHGQSFRRPVRPLLSEAKPNYVYSILKPPGHSSRSQSDRLREVKPSYTDTRKYPTGTTNFGAF